MPTDLRALRDNLMANLGALLNDLTLTERQRDRIHEIHRSSVLISQAVDSYYSASANGHDPRYYLMYAARTPLAAIHLSTYLLGVYHERQSDPCSIDQRASIRAIDDCSRKFVIEVERLWAEMQSEQQEKA